MKQCRTSSFLIVLVVLIIHFVLGWLLAQASFQKVKVEDSFESLQMIEMNLDEVVFGNTIEGLDSARAVEDMTIETQSQSITDSAPSIGLVQPQDHAPIPPYTPKPQEFKSTQVNDVADIAQKPEPIETDNKKLPDPLKSPEKETDNRFELKKSSENISHLPTKTISQATSISQAGDKASSQDEQPSGNKGRQVAGTGAKGGTNSGSASSQGGSQANSTTAASLGAGYGSAMKGACSDISDEADDEGRVTLKVSVNEQGRAQNVQIVSPSDVKRLNNQAKRIASNHIYSPGKSNGQPVASDVVFTINFKCGNAA